MWDPWTGATRPLPVLAQTAEGTRLRLPLDAADAQLIVFSPGQPLVAPASNSQPPPAAIALDGEWEFELQPTMDNRFGDFRWPPSKTMIGAEARRFRYAEETAANPGWQAPALDDSKWPRVTQSFGPQFWKLGPLPADRRPRRPTGGAQGGGSVGAGGGGWQKLSWQPYDFSWQWGLEGDPGHQGYHGLKENVVDSFLCLGAPGNGHNETVYGPEAAGSRYYLWSSVAAPRAGQAHALIGGLRPAAVWLNHQSADKAPLVVRKGANPLLLRYDQPGRGYFVVSTRAGETAPALPEPAERTGAPPAPLTMKWFGDDSVLPFDTRPQVAQPAGWYRFTAPPGLRAMTITARGKVRAWVDGKEVLGAKPSATGRFELPAPGKPMAKVALRIEQERGQYGGAALAEPVALECAAGLIPLGDWSKAGALECYSGGAWYRKTVNLTADQARGTITLDLGKVVASAEVRVNGQPAGIRIAPPWRVDITKLVKPGENRIEVLVYNTLANHYLTIPTRYRGNPTSGLLGPVTLEVAAAKSR